MKSRLRSCLFVFISISMLLLLSIPITSPFQYPVSVATRGICFSNRGQQRARAFNRFHSCIFKQRQKPRTGAFFVQLFSCHLVHQRLRRRTRPLPKPQLSALHCLLLRRDPIEQCQSGVLDDGSPTPSAYFFNLSLSRSFSITTQDSSPMT